MPAKSGVKSIAAATFRMTQKPKMKMETREMEPGIPCEQEHDFALILTGISKLSPDVENALFESGCDDATISVRSGRVFLTFSRNAPSLGKAILSAIRDVTNAEIGAQVLRVDDCNLVTQAEIARRIGRTRQLVNQYISGVRGPGGFPAPTCEINEGALLWRWCEVASWLRQNMMIKENALRAAEEVAVINSVFEFLYHRKLNPDLVLELFSDLKVPGPTCSPETVQA
jgi:hypothetical protein